jgi:hypothetical protein
MHRGFLVAALTLGFALSVAQAQTPAPAASPAPSAASPADASKMTGKEVRAQCREQAEAQGLKGDARKAAVQQCFAAARPDLAKRQQCRVEGKAKGLSDGELKSYVKTCMGDA